MAPSGEPRKLTGRLRFEILRRDGHRCHYCGATAEDAQLTVDHVIPIALGGADDPSNLVTACQSCNAGKAATSPTEQVVEDVDQRAEKWATAIARAAEIQNDHRESVERYVQQFDDAWCEWTFGDVAGGMRPPAWRSTVANWHDAGLEIDTLVALVDDVLPRGVPNGRIWRYFCGAAWNVLRQRQALALELLEEEQ